MPQIFVETDNSDPLNKIYDASMAGGSAGPAEAMMQKVVRKIIAATADFTTTKTEKSKGYIIKLRIDKLETANRQAKCRLEGMIVRYPANDYGPEGNAMVSTKMTGGATATGRNALLDCVESITEDLMKLALPAMRTDPLRPK